MHELRLDTPGHQGIRDDEHGNWLASTGALGDHRASPLPDGVAACWMASAACMVCTACMPLAVRGNPSANGTEGTNPMVPRSPAKAPALLPIQPPRRPTDRPA